MKPDDALACHLARDLFIPYLADEIRPETRAWVDAHLAECETCRAELTALGSPKAPLAEAMPEPRADSGRRVLRRVRGWVLALLGFVVLSLGVSALSLYWFVPSLHSWANMPAQHPVPPDGVTPEEATHLDLTHLGLTLAGVEPEVNGAVASYRDRQGHTVKVGAYCLPSDREAILRYRAWRDRFDSNNMMVVFDTPGSNSVKFRSDGFYLYGWRTDHWFVSVEVPDDVPDAAALRDQIRDALVASFVVMPG